MSEFNKLKYLQLLRYAALTHAEYRVLVTLLTYADPDGTNAHPGYAKLSRECRASKGTVSKGIKRLKRLGWLWQESSGIRGEHSQVAAVYRLTVPPYLQRDTEPVPE